MIIGGGSRCNWRWFSKHLMNGTDNELVRVAEIRGLPADNILDAFDEMRLMASVSQQCKNFFYHADLNTRADERLTERQWDKAVDTLENNLGLEGQPRFVVEHEKDGRTHRHVIWSRIDPDTMKAISDSRNYDVHMRTADALEKEFGHETTPRGRGPNGKNPENWEVFRGKQSGIDAYDVKAELSALWRQSDTGQAFAAALEANGYILAQGDRRDFVAVDQAGHEHSLGRRVGAKATEIRARMADVERDDLPTVAEARAIARERAAGRKDRDERDSTAFEVLADAAREVVAGKERPAERPAQAEPTPGPKDAAAGPGPCQEAPSAADPAHGPFREPEPSSGPQQAPAVEEIAAAATVAPEPTAFDRLAQELLREAKPPLPAPEPANDVERMARDFMAAMREPAPVSLSADPDAWGHQMAQAMDANGGGDGLNFWERSAARLAFLRDRVTAWAKDAWQDLVERFTRGRTPGRDPSDPGFER